jgi:hypothetical protein
MFSSIPYEDDKAFTFEGGYGLQRSLLNVEELTRRLLSKP